MDPQRLKDEFGDRLSFHGGIDIIKTLPRGSVDDVKAEVAERMRVLGRNGGYILASSHHIQSDTPLDKCVCHVRPGRPHTAGSRDGERQWLTTAHPLIFTLILALTPTLMRCLMLSTMQYSTATGRRRCAAWSS